MGNFKQNEQKGFGVTRWSAHYEALKEITNGYTGILQSRKFTFTTKLKSFNSNEIQRIHTTNWLQLENAVSTIN